MSKEITEQDINEEFADLAEALLKMSQVGDAITNSRLKNRTIYLLIRDMTGVNFGDIGRVLDALPRLKGYLK